MSTSDRVTRRDVLRAAVAMGATFAWGAQNAYRRMAYDDERTRAEEQLWFVLHLGDFVYEVVDYPEDFPGGHRYDRRLRLAVRYPHRPEAAQRRPRRLPQKIWRSASQGEKACATGAIREREHGIGQARQVARDGGAAGETSESSYLENSMSTIEFSRSLRRRAHRASTRRLRLHE